MNRKAVIGRTALVFVVLCFFSGLASAQATRTWVSGVGDDANPCSRTAPCKTFAGAISKTAALGTINVLDSGGFGGITITKSITIEADGTIAGVLTSGTNGIIINAGANDVVMLRNLRLQGLNTSLNAVRVLGAKTVVLEDLVIEGYADHAIDIEPAGAIQVSARNVVIRNAESGLYVKPGAAGSAAVSARDLQVVEAQYGVQAHGPSTVTVRDSDILSSTAHGVWAVGTATTAVAVSLDRVTVRDSVENGLFADGVNAEIRVSASEISANAQGLLASGGGVIASYGGNRVVGNVVDGAPTQTRPTL